MLQKRQKAQGLLRSIKKGSGFVKGCRTEEFVVVGWVGRNFIDLNCVCISKIGNMHRLKLTIDYALSLSKRNQPGLSNDGYYYGAMLIHLNS